MIDAVGWGCKRLRAVSDHPLALIVLLALVVRLTAALLGAHQPRSDETDYVALASALARGEGFADHGALTAYRAPGYPLLVAGILLGTGYFLNAVLLVQAILDTLTCVLVFYLGRRLANQRVGLLAALIYAVFPLQILYVTAFMTETLFTLLLTGTLLVLVSPRLSPGHIFAAGAMGGCAILVRPAALVLPALVVLAPSMRKYLPIRRVAMMAVFGLGMTTVIAPWLLRNYANFGRIALTSSTGVNFWIGNHQGANGTYDYPAGNALDTVDGEFSRSDAGMRLGLTSWAERPGETIVRLGRKHAHLFGIDYWILVHQLRPTGDVERASAAVAHIPLWAIALTQLPVVLIVILALVGFARMSQDQMLRWRLMGGLVLGWVALHLVFFGAARFRLPLHPIIILAAASVPGFIGGGLQPRLGRRQLILLVWGVLLAGGWCVELWMLLALR